MCIFILTLIFKFASVFHEIVFVLLVSLTLFDYLNSHIKLCSVRIYIFICTWRLILSYYHVMMRAGNRLLPKLKSYSLSITWRKTKIYFRIFSLSSDYIIAYEKYTFHIHRKHTKYINNKSSAKNGDCLWESPWKLSCLDHFKFIRIACDILLL